MEICLGMFKKPAQGSVGNCFCNVPRPLRLRRLIDGAAPVHHCHSLLVFTGSAEVLLHQLLLLPLADGPRLLLHVIAPPRYYFLS